VGPRWTASGMVQAGYRTPVTKFSAFERYRFCALAHPESGHAKPSCQEATSAVCSIRSPLLIHVFSWLCAGALRGHTGRIACCDRRELLLPLRGIERAPRLRENVRQTEISGAPVGNELRQAAHEPTRPEGRCRAPLSAPRSRGEGADTKARNRQLGRGLRLEERA
jgi:hypothetical protein